MNRKFTRCLALGCVAAAIWACSSNDHKASPSHGGTVLPDDDGGTTEAGKGDGGPNTGDGATPDGTTPTDGGGGDGNDLGPLPIVEVADTPCTELSGGEAQEITPEDTSNPLFTVLGNVGSRRFALSPDGLSLFTFDPDAAGTQSAFIAGITAGASEGTTIAALSKPSTALSLVRYNANGGAVGNAVALVSNNDWQAIAAGPAKVFVVWSKGSKLEGRLFDIGGTTPTTVDLGADAAGTGTYVMGVVASGTGFVVVWTRNRTDGQAETLWTRVEANATVAAAKTLILSPGHHSFSGLVAQASGVAVLVNEGQPSQDLVVMRVSDSGDVVNPAYRLGGSERGLGVATNNGEIGVLAVKTNRAAFRGLASDGSALGPWMCLDDSDGGSAFYPAGAIDVEAAGYAVLTRATNGAAVFRRLDNTGAAIQIDN
jgi:hypothetical protein